MRNLGSNRLVALTIMAAACGSPAEPGPRLQPGVISFHADPVVIDVPETVQEDIPFEVTVRTYGGGCVVEDVTEVDVAAQRADIRPMDRHSGDELCTAELRMFEHTVSLTFHEDGEAIVFVHGMAQPGDSAVVFARAVRVE